MPFTLATQWCIVILTSYAYLLVEDTRNISIVTTTCMWWIRYMNLVVKQEDRLLSFKGMGQSKSYIC